MSNNSWQKVGYEKTNIDTYFNSKYALNYGDVADLANYVISPPVWASIFQKPSDWISSLTYYPFNAVYDGTFQRSKLMIGVDKTDIGCTRVSSAFGWFNLGELKIQRYFNNFADYNGYTKIAVWLPFYGFIDVNPNDVMDKYLEFTLSVDYNSGQAVYYVGVSDISISRLENRPNFASSLFENARILSTHTFQLGYNIPLGSTNAAETYRNIILGAAKAATVAVGAYATGAVGAGITSSKSTTITKTSGTFTRTSPKTGRQIKPGNWDKTVESETTRTNNATAYLKGKAVNEIFNYSSQALSSLSVGATTDVVNNPNLLCNGSNSVKVVIYRPKLREIDGDYLHIYGAPLGEVRQLITLSGYTEISDVHLESSYFRTATETELAMISDSLLNGVILP